MTLAKPDLDPENCLLRLNARISRQPHELVPVRSVIAWVDLIKHKLVERHDLAFDGRLDLLAMRYPMVIEQAKGMLAKRRHVEMNTAFNVLRNYARNTDQKLSDVARTPVTDALAAEELQIP